MASVPPAQQAAKLKQLSLSSTTSSTSTTATVMKAAMSTRDTAVIASSVVSSATTAGTTADTAAVTNAVSPAMAAIAAGCYREMKPGGCWCARTEGRLLAEAGQNSAARGLLLLQMARLRSDTSATQVQDPHDCAYPHARL